MAIIGYARVSTDGQSLDAQQDALKAAGAVKVFAETMSGATASNRPQLAKALKALSAGDVLVVTRLDRLARSTVDLLNTVKVIRTAGAAFKSLADGELDASTAHGNLVMGVLAVIGEFERELIKARTGEGRVRAKAKGVKFGRPGKLTPYQQREAIERHANGESLASIGKSFNVSHQTVMRLVADAEARQS